MIQVTMTFASREEMLAFFAADAASAEARPPVQAPTKATRAPKPEAAATPPTAPAPQAAAPEQKAETSAPATPASAPAEPPAAPAIPYEKVGTAIQNLVAKDRSKAVAVLASLGVKKGTELKPEQYADALARLEAALTEADQALA